jgi:hypothetical protein
MRSPTGRQALSGSELHRLLALRSRLRAEIVGAPRRVQRDVLEMMEAARQARQDGRVRRWVAPEMTRDEVIREIKWRLDAAGLDEVDAAARVMARARRRMRVGTGEARTS